MYAVIETGGKQYRVANGDVITIERLAAEPGKSITFDQVLMVGEGDSATVGTPTVAGVSVSATVLEQGRHPKIIVFKKKRRKGYRRTHGHRQDMTVLRITDIAGSGTTKKRKATADSDATPKKPPAPKAAAKAKPAGEEKPKAKAAPAKKTTAKKAADRVPAEKKSEE